MQLPTPANLRLFCIILTAAIFLAAVYPSVTASLWRDEAGSLWIVKDGFKDMFTRSLEWSATSPCYYMVLWISSRFIGTSEIALRLPSVVFFALSIFLLSRLASFWMDRESAFAAGLFYVALWSSSAAAINARPYALGLLLLIAAWLAFGHWLLVGRPLHLWLSVIFAVAAVYAHYIFALALLPFLLFVVQPRALGARSHRSTFAVAVAVAALLLLPLGLQLRQVAADRRRLSWPSAVSVSDLFFHLIPLEVVLPFLIAYLLGSAVHGGWRLKFHSGSLPLAPLLAWATAPPLLLYFFQAADQTNLFHPRYFVSKQPAVAILLAFLLASVPLRRTRIVITLLAAITAIVLFASFRRNHVDERWREAVQSVNAYRAKAPATPVLVESGFIESMDPAAFRDPRKAQILFAPLIAYPLVGDFLRLPLKPTPECTSDLLRHFGQLKTTPERWLLICSQNCLLHERDLLRSFAPIGLRPVRREKHGGVQLIELAAGS